MTVFYDERQMPFRFALLARAIEHDEHAALSVSDPAHAGYVRYRCAWHFEQAKLARDLAAVMGDAMPLYKSSRWPQ